MPHDSAAIDAAPAVDDRIRSVVDTVLLGSPVARALGVRLHRLEIDHMELLLPFHADLVTHGDTVHGGVIATLVDICGAAAAGSGADAGTLQGGATSSLALQYLAPARGTDLLAIARVLRRGRKQVATDITVHAGGSDGELVAKALMGSVLF
ncbi:acyl-CoA thioesterase [Cupriavidus sp. USMAA2-4]|uniref:PaaI family thioesterase n=1 Tax=Cupriavidus sp. USMAA2-4 TaxID=876364 RepID=UPI0008A6FBE4|nr:PaaI family thioesterase [Cupriavidus sp. USMAA2-4]AOY90820.1 acyl-CoA thioesterase [Cupriavidus sp. USMAA2-4]